MSRDGDPVMPLVDQWFVDARRKLSPEVQHDLDLLFGFSGRLLYYGEELMFSFDPLEPDRLDASYEDFVQHLRELPAIAYQRMAANAVRRLYRDQGTPTPPPESSNPDEWREYLCGSVISGDLDELVDLMINPEQLKARSVRLLDEFWQVCYREELERTWPELQRAVRHAQALIHPVVQVSFSELTGHRLPEDIALHLSEVERVTYCPSSHLGSFIQYIYYPPELILFFNPSVVLDNAQPSLAWPGNSSGEISETVALAGMKAIADPTRLRILSMLREREHYAQEIVGKLGISQSAVSRHLSTLEAAQIVSVRPNHGMKYYAIDNEHIRTLAGYILQLSDG
ncbi:MAG TPA: metalloregulator ArsR/SmtB family transcription factor [Thermomicrobiales bacterium]|nr:metalloregulator ArsR/SmtB family transcription factor [Thermomicrobiales bacterium]